MGDRQRTGDRLGSATQIAVSAFVVCKDEARTIEAVLTALARCAEIVVVDSGSTDGTLEIVSRLTSAGLPIRLFTRDWPGYAAQKQFALEQCRMDWCLNVDADEVADSALMDAIAGAIASPGAAEAFSIRRRQWLVGYGYAHPLVRAERIVRLVRRNHADFDLSQRVHETMRVTGRVERTEQGWLLHEDRSGPETVFAKMNRYSTLKACQRLAAGGRPLPYRIVSAPFGYFLKTYLLKRYFLCGRAGLAHALVSAVYAFQTEYKHWQGADRR